MMSKDGAPQFLQALPPETDATDGDIVTFQVKVNISSKVSWWRCGETLVSAPGRREIIGHEDGWHELIISNVSEEDEGEYECRAENLDGITSCFGSLYYYQHGAACTITDVTMESSYPREGDGRQSGLLILIDDGSHTEEEECASGGTNRKSLTVSEQIQGIIEDLTQSTQGENTRSLTIEKEDEDQFNSDIESEEDLIEKVFRASQDTLVADIPSPDLRETTMSEGADDPYAIKLSDTMGAERCRSNPITNISSATRSANQIYPWPPEAVVTFDLPPDTTTTSVDLPPLDTEEARGVSSIRTMGSETPFGVADITEELADINEKDQGGATKEMVAATSIGPLPRAVAFEEVSFPPFTQEDRRGQNLSKRFKIGEESSITSVSEIQEKALSQEGFDRNKMFSSSRSSFQSSSLKYSAETTEDLSRTSVQTTSMTSRVTSATSALEDDDDSATSISIKRLKSSGYRADESSLSTSLRSTDKAIVQESHVTGDLKVRQ